MLSGLYLVFPTPREHFQSLRGRAHRWWPPRWTAKTWNKVWRGYLECWFWAFPTNQSPVNNSLLAKCLLPTGSMQLTGWSQAQLGLWGPAGGRGGCQGPSSRKGSPHPTPCLFLSDTYPLRYPEYSLHLSLARTHTLEKIKLILLQKSLFPANHQGMGEVWWCPQKPSPKTLVVKQEQW